MAAWIRKLPQPGHRWILVRLVRIVVLTLKSKYIYYIIRNKEEKTKLI